MSRIFILGAGALGRGLAGHLARQHEIAYIVRSPQLQPAAISREDKHQAISDLLTPTHPGLPNIETITGAQLWICCKAYDLLAALKQILPGAKHFSQIVLCCNGLGIYQDAAEVIGTKIPLVRCLCSTGFMFGRQGEVLQSGKLIFSLSAAHQHSHARDELRSVLQGLEAQVHDESSVVIAEWRKVLTNCVVNTVCTIANTKNGALLADPILHEQACQLLKEVRAVAACEGISLSSPSEAEFFAGLANHAENYNSTLLDLRAGRRSETNFMLGRVVRLAQAYGCPTPLARSLLEKISQLERRSQGA